MARPVALSLTTDSQPRTVTGAPVAADSATLTDANFSPTPDNVLGGAFNCYGFSTVWLNAEFTGGTSPTVTLDMLFRDDGAANGSRWRRVSGLSGPTLDGTGWQEVRVDGSVVYPRLGTVTGSPTGINLLARSGVRLSGYRSVM
jgi:hypothetical protein